ncbi:OmpA family protein [Pontibacter cellulosilyticus]|uniref:PD40 domain-containing protein n=1 Tax=Pontibacter cellulosilyticus TaxID=1720253 RepID=A0A923N8P8_9BACT|nr:OmpA family protein [Pontibacter cellulosilyticus]MBC5993837.1 PD40 domain-containing protein [Pontibacter cellulosilyticus]
MNYKSTPLYFVIAAMMGLGTAAQAQTELKKANKQYENYEFALALENYQVAVQKKDPDLSTMQRIADAYRLTRQNQKAEEWYARVVQKEGHDPMSLYHYAEALHSNGKYEEAKANYGLWAKAMPEKNEKANELIAACERAMVWASKPAAAVVSPVESINMGGFSDFSPMQYGNQIIFTSDRGLADSRKADVYGWTGRPYLQLFTAQQDEAGSWGAPKALEEVINSEYHNATASAAENGKMLYFTRTHMVPKRKPGNSDPTSWIKEPVVKEFVNRLEIFTAEKQGNVWANIKPFAYNKVEEYSVGHPAISPDGKTLYFASDMEGTLGDTDIFYSTKQADGSWGKPVNAGPTINTAARESFPYVDADGKLYFASDGHMGFGGLDMFEAEGAHAAWTKVRNVGAPINSAKNDYGIMFTKAGEEGLFSSNRDSENGTEDIYSFKMLQRPVVIQLITLERKQNEEKRNIEVPLPGTKILVAQKNLNDSSVVITNERGQYFMDGRRGDAYTLLGTKDGYLTQKISAEVPATAGDTVQIAMLFDKNEVNRAIVLENIYYDLDKWDIRPDAATELDKLVAVLKSNPKVKIEMSSHTDSRESVKYNNVLSERRAKAAVDYLVSQGIDRGRLTAKGYGKSKLVNGCADGVECSEEDHQLNRRTEFKIIN